VLVLVKLPPFTISVSAQEVNSVRTEKGQQLLGEMDRKWSGTTQASRLSAVKMNQVARLTCECQS
jgi:hypothetical protein